MAIEVLKNPKYDVLDPIVEDIYIKCVKLDHTEEQILNGKFQVVISQLVAKMRKVDSTFNQIFNRIGYTGSFFDGLRIGKATEFDLNLILKPKFKMKIMRDGVPPGYIGIKVIPNEHTQTKPYKNWIQDNVFDPDSVRSWLQSVVSKALTEIYKDEQLKDCQICEGRQSGPAWTVVIASQTKPTKTIDVDLVPVLEFPSSDWPTSTCKKKKLLNGSSDETWFAVPKPPKENVKYKAWRLSFPQQETAIIKSQCYLKYTLRLLKKVRDELCFHSIASYYIKTLFLWEVENQDNSIWVQSKKGRLFIHMLLCLRDALKTRSIPFFWDKNCNLIKQVKQECLSNHYGNLKRFLNIIENLIDSSNIQQLEQYLRDKLNT